MGARQQVFEMAHELKNAARARGGAGSFRNETVKKRECGTVGDINNEVEDEWITYDTSSPSRPHPVILVALNVHTPSL